MRDKPEYNGGESPLLQRRLKVRENIRQNGVAYGFALLTSIFSSSFCRMWGVPDAHLGVTLPIFPAKTLTPPSNPGCWVSKQFLF